MIPPRPVQPKLGNVQNNFVNAPLQQGTSKQPQINDYVKLMRCLPTSEELTRLCISGDLRTSSVRGIVWMMLLKCLPYDKEEWSSVLTRSRNTYTHLKAQHVTDPHMQDSISLDPCIVNPLSDAEHNPWKKFFEDGHLRELITKDVLRTFPEMEFFQQDRIRQILSDVLLVYAKENPYISYKQGMHEILAPLLFVLFCDQQTYEHYTEIGLVNSMSDNERSILATVYDNQYLEHDSYMLLTEVMRDICVWYEDGSSPTSEDNSILSTVEQPFMRIQDAPSTSRLMDELASIGVRLQEVDPTLHKHLSSYDIPPQLYGIRWLRLLFGREFPLHDLLFIWDVLFSQQPLTRFVHCMFVAMLVHIRSLLLACDYSGCLQYLMRYPPVVDVSAFVRLVLHLRYPTKHARPRQEGTVVANYSHITVAGTAHPNRGQDTPIVLAKEVLSNSPYHRSQSMSCSTTSRPAPLRPPPPPPPSTTSSTFKSSRSIFGRGSNSSKSSSRKKDDEMAMLTPKKNSAVTTPASSTAPSPVENGRITDDDRRCEQLVDDLRERDMRMADCARSIKKLAAELAQPVGASEEKRKEVAEKLIEIARHLTLRVPPSELLSVNQPCAAPIRELQELRPASVDNSRLATTSFRIGGGGGVANGAQSARGLFCDLPSRYLRRRSHRQGSTSSTDSTASTDLYSSSGGGGGVGYVGGSSALGAHHPTTLNRRLQKKVISCPVLYAPRF